MNTYSGANLLEEEMFSNIRKRKGIFSFIESIINSYSKTVLLKITIPSNILIRTKILCEYISSEVAVEFELENFIMVIYLNFINGSIKKYNPKDMLKQISKSYDYDNTLQIVCGNEVYEYKKSKYTNTELIIEIDKKDVLKGEMLLSEIDELFGYKTSFEKMLSTLWINFIEKYKRGDNNKALNDIIKILKNSK